MVSYCCLNVTVKRQIVASLCRALREKAYRAYVARASSGATDNSPVIEQMMALRQEQAHLADFDNAAKYFMANKVCIRPQTEQFLVLCPLLASLLPQRSSYACHMQTISSRYGDCFLGADIAQGRSLDQNRSGRSK